MSPPSSPSPYSYSPSVPSAPYSPSSPSALEQLINLGTQFAILLRDNTVTAFFIFLVCGVFVWTFAFHYLFTKSCMIAFFRSIGVGHGRIPKMVQELKRKSFHLFGLLIPFIYYTGLKYTDWLTRNVAIWLLGICCILLWCVEFGRILSPEFRQLYNSIFASMLRRSETAMVSASFSTSIGILTGNSTGNGSGSGNGSATGTSAGTSTLTSSSTSAHAHAHGHGHGALCSSSSSDVRKRKPTSKLFTGTGFFFLGNWLCVYCFEPTIATCAMLFLVLGDLTAAVVGISFGRIRIGSKSLEGTLAMFLTCFFIGEILFWHVQLSEYVVFVGAAAATLTELLGPEWCDDNLSIPFVSGIALHLAFWRIGRVPPLP